MTALAKIHILKKQLGLDDDTYRAMLKNLTGMTSAKDLNKQQRLKVIGYMNAMDMGHYGLAGKTAGELRCVIDDLLKQQGKFRAYAQEIATRMHKKALAKCEPEELLQVIDAIKTQG